MSNYYPTSGQLVPVILPSGAPAAGYWIKFYIALTETPLSVAINSGGVDDFGVAQLFDKLKLGDKGTTITPSGGDCIAHVDRAYEYYVYATETDANNNNFAVAILRSGRVVPAALDAIQSIDTQETSDLTHLANGNAQAQSLQLYLNELCVTVTNYGADKTGAEDSTAAFAAAYADFDTIYIPDGTYLLSEFPITDDRKKIIFGADVTLKAFANDVVLFNQVSSNCHHIGHFKVDSNSKTGVYGMVVGPEDLTDTTTVVNQIGNTLPGITGDSGVEELVVFQCGPDVTGTNSENRNNVVPFVYSKSSRRAVWFKSAANAGALIPKGNKVERLILDETNTTNTALQIDAGTLNEIHAAAIQGVSNGSTPNATPTGIKIANTCSVTSLSNDNNKIFGGSILTTTRHIDNANATTRSYGLTFTTGSSVLGGMTSV